MTDEHDEPDFSHYESERYVFQDVAHAVRFTVQQFIAPPLVVRDPLNPEASEAAKALEKEISKVNQTFVAVWNAIYESGGGRIHFADQLLACPVNAAGLHWGVLRVQVAELQKEWLAKHGYIAKEEDHRVHCDLVNAYVNKINKERKD